jgi:hypothetical protein
MAFRLVQVQFDHVDERAYVELREPDADGGEVILTAIFSYKCKSIYSQHELERDLGRKARHMLKRASTVIEVPEASRLRDRPSAS